MNQPPPHLVEVDGHLPEILPGVLMDGDDESGIVALRREELPMLHLGPVRR